MEITPKSQQPYQQIGCATAIVPPNSMKHTLVSCELSKRSIEWKDRMANYHLWKVKTRCPVDDRIITERVHGTKDQAINACVNNPECKCQEVANAN